MTYMDIVDMVAPNIKNTVVTLTEVIGIGNSELLVKVPVANMRLHTAPKSHVQDVSMSILVMIWLQWRTAITAKIIWRIVEVIIQVTGLERLKVPARAPAV